MDQRYDVVLGFTYAALMMVSERNLAVFREMLKELNADPERIRAVSIDDDELLAALRGLGQLKRIRETLERIRKKRSKAQKEEVA